MQIRYYETAWKDLSNSPGWFGKLCLLALVNFIPIFGQIVTLGYLYGWAREIAWGVHAPMPAKIINNEDGKFWRRGGYAFLIAIAFAIVPNIISNIGQGMQLSGNLTGLGSLLYLIGVVGAIFMAVLAWIGCMRASIYDDLSAGFQFGTLWKMFRHDTNGLLRIVGMEIALSFILGIVLSIVISFLMAIALFMGVAGLMNAGFSFDSIGYDMTDAQAISFFVQLVASAGFVGMLCLVAMTFVAFLTVVFIDSLVLRAVGYWTSQFDVARWGGKDAPLPFETGPQSQAAGGGVNGYGNGYRANPPAAGPIDVQAWQPPQQDPTQAYAQPQAQAQTQPQPQVQTQAPADIVIAPVYADPAAYQGTGAEYAMENTALDSAAESVSETSVNLSQDAAATDQTAFAWQTPAVEPASRADAFVPYPSETPTYASAEAPAYVSADASTNLTTGTLIEEPTQASIDNPAEAPVDPPTGVPVATPADAPATAPASAPGDTGASWPADDAEGGLR